MVKEFNIKSVTDAGASEMQRALDQGLAMTFTRIVTGNGTYEEDEDVSGRTALKNQKNSYSFSGREDEVDGITLKAVLTNYDGSQSLVPTSYFINEIGIYISVGGTETLYAIAAVGDGNGTDMPAYNGRNYTQIKQDWFVACSNSANIEVDVTGGFALAEDLEAHEDAKLTDSDGVHGARVVADGDDYKVQAKIGGNWTDVTGGAKGGSRITVYTEEETLIGKNAVLKKGSTTIATKTIAANGTAVFEGVTEIGTLSVYASDGNESTTEDIEVPYYGVYDVELLLGTVHAINITTAETTLYGKTVTLTNGVDTKTGTLSAEGKAAVKIKFTGSVTISSTDGTKTATKVVTVSSGTVSLDVTLSFVQIYGAEWDGTSTTAWTRTDASENFTDPVPYISGAQSYGSPFDDLMPWSGMEVSTRDGNVMVSIPKFYYKITQSGAGMKVQIADGEVDGFNVSPAHMDRGDGAGERDVVYVGRYHCNSSYKSAGGGKPVASITRSAARTSIHNTGSKIWQMDFATRFTLWLLYIVEFADWNSQAKIGYGCGNNSATENMGYTDSMPYHTGTTLSSRTTYGLGTQYRGIEGLWDNVYDWIDGCYYNSSGLNIIMNPNSFSDSSGGTAVGVPSSGYPSAFSAKDVSGTFQMFIPTAASGSESTYSCDGWSFNASSPCLCVGGYYSRNGGRGLFYVNYSTATGTDASIGCRLLELP